MSKILLISSNTTIEPSPVYPLGMAVIASALTARYHDVEQFDFLFSGKTEEKLIKTISLFKPDYIGISIRNIDNVDSFSSEKECYLNQSKYLVKLIRKISTSPVILGGPAFSIMPEEILNFIKADFGIVGEGEKSLCDLIESLNKGMIQPEIIKNTIHLSGDEICAPLFKKEFVNYYIEHAGMINYQTKRGCPHSCNYCTYPNLEGKKFRVQDPEFVVDNVEKIRTDFNVDTFFFTDSVFNDKDGHYLEVAEEMVKRKIPIRWVGYFRPQHMNKNDLILLKRSGLFAMEVGTDAGSDATMEGINKKFTFSDAIKFNLLCNEEKIPTAHFFMFGGPNETEATVKEGLKNIEKLKHSVVFVFSGIRIFTGTALENIAIKEGIINKNDSLLKSVYYISPEINYEVMNKTIEKGFNKRKDRIFPPQIGQMRLSAMHLFGYRGLLWDRLITFK